jgi:hypothetical protein
VNRGALGLQDGIDMHRSVLLKENPSVLRGRVRRNRNKVKKKGRR